LSLAGAATAASTVLTRAITRSAFQVFIKSPYTEQQPSLL
jgi:hypothetical protein